MGFAKSGARIYNRRKWKKRLEEQEPGCRHEIMKGMDGFMVCQRCGFMRFPEPWENAGDPPLVRQAKEDAAREEELIIRTEGSGTDF